MSETKHSKDIQRRIHEFRQWHYQFDLKGHLTPIRDESWINRHNQRKGYFWDPLVSWYGGTLKGKRVLDLGCNAGFWSLLACENDCDYVLGIDARKMHIEQARLVFELNEIPPASYDFVLANVFGCDLDFYGPFDIVLCLGFFYHINRHVELLDRISALDPEVLIIDTSLSKLRGSVLELQQEHLHDPRYSADYPIAYYPTAQAVFDLLQMFGFTSIMLEPSFADYHGAEDYRGGFRRAFICSRKRDVSSFPAPIQGVEDLPNY